jgi:hypothetical protein
LTASKWKIAALTLVTLPATIWFVAENPDLPISKFMLALGFLPLYIGASIELYGQWKALWDNWGNPERRAVGSPTGNKMSVILGLTLLGLVAFLAYVGATHRT